MKTAVFALLALVALVAVAQAQTMKVASNTKTTTAKGYCHTSAYVVGPTTGLDCAKVTTAKTALWAGSKVKGTLGTCKLVKLPDGTNCATIMQSVASMADWRVFNDHEKSKPMATVYNPLKAAGPKCAVLKKSGAC